MWTRNTEVKSLLFHNILGSFACISNNLVHCNTGPTASRPIWRTKQLWFKCLAQGHRRSDWPGQDSNHGTEMIIVWLVFLLTTWSANQIVLISMLGHLHFKVENNTKNYKKIKWKKKKTFSKWLPWYWNDLADYDNSYMGMMALSFLEEAGGCILLNQGNTNQC